MNNAIYRVPQPTNEPILAYLPGSPERAALKAELEVQSNKVVKIPLVIGGREIFTDTTTDVVMPFDHGHVLAKCCVAGEKELKMAVDAALAAKPAWEALPWEQRAAVFLKAAELISGPWRATMNAATMLGQSKTAYQAEIDSACELIDFLRFNAYYAEEIFAQQPASSKGCWNRQEYRPLDGFILAITPFNFTAIAGNLGSAPAQLGNTVVWKPSGTALLSNYYFMQVLKEAGLPDGVINFIHSGGDEVSRHVLSHPRMAGVHFTGSAAVFQSIWGQVGRDISNYVSYPRLVGETGGKDFVFAHASANVDALVSGLVRGAFEYQGQKCSAASRAFIPESLWPAVRERMLKIIGTLKVGDVRDFTSFIGAVIDKASFDKIKGYIDRAQASPDAEVLCGGCDDSKGWFVQPTVILAKTPTSETMVEEIFGPVLTVYVYPDDRFEETLAICDSASPYALTGAIYAADRGTIRQMTDALHNAAGNFYVNDKPTGAVVGQQPFGGARASGTNDKAGSIFNLLRWVSVRTIKETLVPISDITYGFMQEP